MKRNNSFPFIDNPVLRKNLDIAFDLIIELIAVSESNHYNNAIISSFRKTIIIYTATIIEALLLWKLKKRIGGDGVELKEYWKYNDVRKIHGLKENPLEEIIWCRRKLKVESKKFARLTLVEINRVCQKYKIITKNDFRDVEKVRKLRNRLHIGGLKKIERDYTKNDLKFVFRVAKKVKDLC